MKSLLPILLCLLSSFQMIEDTMTIPILTPSMNERKIAKLRLDNGLEAYLISDPHTSDSAAALSVEVGSWHDPEDYPGMAHFLEHMLFMGSKAYPVENEHSAFIRDHGGEENAFTANDRTVYGFSVNHNAFPEALDRFSHFFVDPLFSPSSLKREVIAVDEEFAIHKESDAWQKWMIIKETGNQNHPNALFCIGNQTTLSGVTHTIIKNWHDKHYSADRMHLVLLSPLPIEDLIAQTDQLFSPIPSKKKSNTLLAHKILSTEQKGNMIYVEGEEDTPRLDLIWEFSQENLKPLTHMAMEMTANVLEYPLKNGLLQILKRKGFAHDVTVMVDPVSKNHQLFMIQIDLSEKGLEAIDATIAHCFQTLSRYQLMGIPSYIHEEIAQLDTLSYQYQSRDAPFETAMFHADNLIDEDLASYPAKHVRIQDYDQVELKNFARKLTPKQCLFMLTADPEVTKVPTPHMEKWTGIRYGRKPINPNTLDLWQDAFPHPAIAYPLPNPYQPKPTLANPLSNPSVILLDSDAATIYFQQDSVYRTPEITTLFTIHSPLLDKSARSEILLSLFIQALNEQLGEISYFAPKAGLRYKFSKELGRLKLEVSGYSDQAPLLLQAVFSKLAHIECTEKDFDFLRHVVLYTLISPSTPITQAQLALHEELFPSHPTLDKHLEAVQEVTREDFLDFSRRLFHQYTIEGLIYGNLTQSDAAKLWKNLKEQLPTSSEPFFPLPPSTPTIPDEGLLIVEMEAEANHHATLLCLSQGAFSFSNLGAQKILSLALKEAFFDTLRTKQQTGYHVQAWDEEIEKQLFQLFAVESSRYLPDDLLNRFEDFLDDYLLHLTKYVPENRFYTLKNSVIATLKQPADDLTGHARRLHHLATERQGDFLWFDTAIAAAKTLTYEEFLAFARMTLDEEIPRLAILIKTDK